MRTICLCAASIFLFLGFPAMSQTYSSSVTIQLTYPADWPFLGLPIGFTYAGSKPPLGRFCSYYGRPIGWSYTEGRFPVWLFAEAAPEQGRVSISAWQAAWEDLPVGGFASGSVHASGAFSDSFTLTRPGVSGSGAITVHVRAATDVFRGDGVATLLVQAGVNGTPVVPFNQDVRIPITFGVPINVGLTAEVARNGIIGGGVPFWDNSWSGSARISWGGVSRVEDSTGAELPLAEFNFKGTSGFDFRNPTELAKALQMESTPSPRISIRNTTEGKIAIDFVGQLEWSSNLIDWTPVPQSPASPYIVQTLDQTKFFRAAIR